MGQPHRPDDEDTRLGTPPGRTSELRHLAAMFVDLCDFTELSGELDPEDLQDLLERFFAEVDGVIAGAGGTVDKHLGDGVLALFGAPLARDSDTRRAVEAAFAIHAAMPGLSDAVGRAVAAHIGIASGQVLIVAAGGQHSVTGQCVNLASRLSDMAIAGETLISDAVRTALADDVQVAPCDDVMVKGFARPVRVWRALRLRGEAGAEDRRPLIGRRAEMQRLKGLLEASIATGRGSAVSIRGEAGIGKTRLVEALATEAAARGVSCHLGLVLDFGTGRGRDAIGAILRSLCQALMERQTDDVGLQAVRNGLLQPDQRGFLNDLLGEPQPEDLRRRLEAMDPEARRNGMRETLRTLVRAAAERQPLLIAIEDLHWAGPETLDLVRAIAAAAADAPVLLASTSRIGEPGETDAAAPSTTIGPAEIIELGALPPQQALALAGLYVDPAEEVARQCVARAGGNPLFLEQLLRNAECGDEVPGTVQSVVLARMDRLAAADRDAAQAASIVGQRFSAQVLRHLLDDPAYDPERLVRHALVRRDGGEFLFVHALVREAVYASLLKSRRRALHRRAASWFESGDVGLAAEHLDRAEDPGAAAAYLRAAEDAAARFRQERALELARRGAAIADAGPVGFGLACLLGTLLREAGAIEASLGSFRQARDLAGGPQDEARAWIGLADGMRIVDRLEPALDALDRAEAALQSAADAAEAQELRARLHALRGNIHFPLGRIERCLEEHGKALHAARRSGSKELEALALGGLGDAEYARGRLRSAHDHFVRCAALCEEAGTARIAAGNLPMIANNKMFRETPAAALQAADEAIAAARDIAHLRAEVIACHVALAALDELDEPARQPPYLDRAKAIVDRLGARRFEAENLVCAARRDHAEGRTDSALAHLDRALSIARETGMGYFGPTVLGTLAVITPDPGQRRNALAEGEHVLDSGAVSHNYFWFYRDAMEASLDGGDWDGVDRYAAALEAFAAAEPLPWSDFHCARARALAAFGRGARDGATMDRLRALRDEAARVGRRSALPRMDAALGAG